jgi:predicted ester cyclase
MNVKQIISKYNIPKSTVAQIADVKPYDFSLYLRDRSLVTGVKADRIEQAIADISMVLDRLARVEIFSPNLRDIPALQKMIEFCKTHSEETEESEIIKMFSPLDRGKV